MADETPKFIEHMITEEDMTANPELKDMGIVVGDIVELPDASDMSPEEIKVAAEAYIAYKTDLAEKEAIVAQEKADANAKADATVAKPKADVAKPALATPGKIVTSKLFYGDPRYPKTMQAVTSVTDVKVNGKDYKHVITASGVSYRETPEEFAKNTQSR